MLTHKQATSLRHYSYRPGTVAWVKELFDLGFLDPNRMLTRVGLKALEEYDAAHVVVPTKLFEALIDGADDLEFHAAKMLLEDKWTLSEDGKSIRRKNWSNGAFAEDEIVAKWDGQDSIIMAAVGPGGVFPGFPIQANDPRFVDVVAALRRLLPLEAR